MLTVYCEKMSQTWLTGPVIGVIGIAIGALLGLCTSYYTQKWQHQNTLQLEQGRTKIKLFTDYALEDLLKYIDTEVDYIQRMYSISNGVRGVNSDSFGSHRLELAKYLALLEMFNDETLSANFKELLGYRDKFGEEPLRNNKGDEVENSSVILEEAASLAGDIKVMLFSHCSFNKTNV